MIEQRSVTHFPHPRLFSVSPNSEHLFMLKPWKMASEAIKPGCEAFSFGHSVITRRPAVIQPSQWRPQRSAFTLAAKRSPKRLKYATQRLFKKGEEMVYVEMDPMVADTWKLEPVVQLIKDGAVGVIPTDTVYAIVCDLRNYSSIERLRRIKGVGNSKPLSILCRSLQDIDIYTTGFPRGNAYGQTNIFRAVKHCLPGPYTFILPASKELPKQCIRSGPSAKYTSRKHVGVRIPDDIICQTILKNLDAPLISTSVKCPAENQWMIDPVMIADIYEPEGLDFLVDGGVRVADPSTVVDMTISPPTIIRLGKGPRLDWMDVEGEDPSAQETLLPLPA
ncbi:hypothetical protein M5K25_028072 [Dendrobium thyrsiflorum]|uniref:Threonylcarbamoyl-AMP synthase n=1 Tax=Dendrobium thyrsiflorum TaxID=117978 RepID=A0ABD0TVN2_DENTH